MDLTVLEDIGLTKSEVKVYMALLELGPSTKGPLVHRSGVSSSKIYDLLEKLMQKGLVSFCVRGNVKYFDALPPKKIIDYIDAKKAEIENQKSELKEILPQLELKRFSGAINFETRVFKGMGGARTSFSDILTTVEEGGEYHVLGISRCTPHFERFILNFHKKRSKCGIRCKITVNELARNVGRQLELIPLTEIRYVPEELFSPVVFNVYGCKTLISISLEELFIQIKSKNLSDGLRAYADYVFSIGKEEI